MRRVLLAFLIAACSPAPRDVSPPDANACEPPYPPCATSCGNGVADQCYVPGTDKCGDYVVMQEQCDGTAVTCQDFGFYGGGITCDPSCLAHWSSCNACAPGTTACQTLSFDGDVWALSASGSLFALATTSHEIAILDANLSILAVSLHDPDQVEALLPMPNGWLAFSGYNFRTVDHAGVLGDAVPFGGGTNPVVAAGPTGVVMLAAFDVASSRLVGELVDASGAIVVPPFTVLANADPNGQLIASDGTSFFIANGTQLVRVAADGTIASTTHGLPAEPSPGLLASTLWDGTTGWVVAYRDLTLTRFDAQRFDATGTLVGAPIALDLSSRATGWITRGGVLYAISSTNMKERLLGFDASGTALPPIEVGTGHGGLVATATPTSLAFAWFAGDRARIALLAP